MPSASVMLRVTGGGAAGICGGAGRECSRRCAAAGRPDPPGRCWYCGRDGIPGRCGYGPGRGGMPGCCVRMGCDGSGRGPPTGPCGRELGYCGRGPGAPPGRGNPDAGGRTAVAPAGPEAAAGRAGAGIGGRSVLGAAGRGTARGADVGSGGVGAVGRCCSMRKRSVGGTIRPGVGSFGAGGAGGGGGAAATGDSGARGASATGGGGAASPFNELGAA